MYEQEVINRQRIIDALASDYSSVYSIVLDTDELRILKHTTEVERRHGAFLREEDGFEKVFRQFVESGCQPEDREDLKVFGSCGQLKEMLKDKKSVSCQYHDIVNQIWEIKFVKMEAEKEPAQTVVAGFLKRDEQIRTQMAQKEEQKRKLQEALNKANEANEAKSRFLLNMSHDIRTPMNAILGFSQLALDEMDDTEKVKDYLQRIISSGNHLMTLINAVLDMSRIESGKVVLQRAPMSLRQFMRQMANMLQVDAQRRNQFFTVEVEVKRANVLCDQVRLSQVVLNCVSNAQKYSSKGGKVEVLLKELPEEKSGYGSYRLVIQDNGIGMSEEFLEHMFDPFEREENSTVSGIQGTGLGMAITKNLVEMMGGRIEVQSKKGKGTRVDIYLSFPLTEDNEKIQEEKAQSRRMPDLYGATILLVEDIAINREFMSTLLKKTGAEVVVAENGKEAVDMIAKANEGDIQLVFMDIQMPIMDGYEATRRIRGMDVPWIQELPILAMTANAFSEDKRKAEDAGMNDYLTKPVDVIELYGKLREYILKW